MKNYFTIQELVKSDTATKLHIDNTPSAEAILHLRELIDKLLNSIREAWGGPVIVTSGFRSQKLNTVVGGSKGSTHLRGYAADLIPGNGQRAKFIKFVQEYLRTHNLPFDQCINEYDRWIHVGLKNAYGLQRRQIFKIS